LIYDDYDLAAYALRGLNASLGRPPGAAIDPPGKLSYDFAVALAGDHPQPDQTKPYFLEYPVAAAWLFALPYKLWPSKVDETAPMTFLDGWHNNIVEHVPETRQQKDLWGRLRYAIRFYHVLGLACLIGMMVIARLGLETESRLAGPIFLFVLPAALYFSANRFDAVPAFLTMLSLACLGRRWTLMSGAWLGAAIMIKLYPVLLAPIVLRYLSSKPRQAAAWLLGALMVMGACTLATLWLYGPEATLAPYRYQLGRSADSFGITFYGHVWPSWLADSGPLGSCFRLGVVGLVVLCSIITRPRDLAGVLTRSVLVVIAFVAMQTFYSPQWLLWITPLLVPLAARQRSVLLLAVALDVITYLTFPVVCDLLGHPHWQTWLTELVYVRAAPLLALAAVLLKQELRPAPEVLAAG
jgi:hypothetical protein